VNNLLLEIIGAAVLTWTALGAIMLVAVNAMW
jgi:hypothetical protein